MSIVSKIILGRGYLWQKTRMKGFCAYNEFEIAGEYEDAGKWGNTTNKVSADNVYKALVYFDKYVVDMTDVECREFISQLIEKIEVYEERQPDGKWIKDIKFKIPMINNETLFGLDNLNQLETVAKIDKI